MNNPYQTTVNPYMQGQAQMPVMANDMQGMQHQQLMQQQQALVNQAGQTQGGSGQGKMMADALRSGKGMQDLKNMGGIAMGSTYNTDPLSEQSRMLAMQEAGMMR